MDYFQETESVFEIIILFVFVKFWLYQLISLVLAFSKTFNKYNQHPCSLRNKIENNRNILETFQNELILKI